MRNDNRRIKSSTVIFIVATITALGATGILASGSIYGQESVPATQRSQSTPPQPLDEPAVAEQYTFNPMSKPPTFVEQCVQYGKELVSKAIPDYNMCDLVVYRQAPPVIRSDGMILNNYSGMGHYIELIPSARVLNDTQEFAGEEGTTAANDTVVAFGEFSLLDPEVVPVHEVLDRYNWTITTIHNHMLDESPKLLFMHWTVTGNPDDIVQQAKEAIMQTSTYDNATSTTAGTNATRGVPSSSGP